VSCVLQCDCGFEARADDQEGLVEEVRRHARQAHGMELSLDEATLLTFRAQLERIRIVDPDSSQKEQK
jgi:predicted small metal-binding protein